MDPKLLHVVSNREEDTKPVLSDHAGLQTSSASSSHDQIHSLDNLNGPIPGTSSSSSTTTVKPTDASTTSSAPSGGNGEGMKATGGPDLKDTSRGEIAEGDVGGEGDGDANGGGGMANEKRPRLRLAHACDRCRKRKIRCDTEQPCGPCKATSSECTFNAPPRRLTKPKPPLGVQGANGSTAGGSGKSGSSSGYKRSYGHDASGAGAGGVPGGEGGKTAKEANLEARLAALEAMLGNVPPKVHNMFLSSLDASLGSSTTMGSNGAGNGMAMGLDSNTWTGLGGNTDDNAWSNLSLGTDGSGGGGFGGNTTLAGFASELASKRKRHGGDYGGRAGATLDLRSDFRGLRKKDDDYDLSDVTKRLQGMSFFYEDEIGQAKWQGASSGFPLLDLLTANNANDNEVATELPQSTATAVDTDLAFLDTSPSDPDSPATDSPSSSIRRTQRQPSNASVHNRSSSPTTQLKSRFFPDRMPRPHQTLNPEASWKVITGVIPPDLMDTLVRCYLSTSHLLWPFLHVPSFLADYANPRQWGEPGFACFIVAVCTLSSRHVDDPRVRANPLDPSTAGKSYFELFKRLRDLPSADRPTLYSIQAAFLAAIYAFGLGNLSKAFALQAESITLCLDGGLQRSVDAYDHFDAIEKETRKRTFWSIYSWDKQSAALFGRPPIINLRVTDTPEPLIVDDENLTAEGIKESANSTNSRMEAFVATIRLHVILEGILDTASRASSFPTSPFLSRAASHLAKRYPQSDTLQDEEDLLEEWKRILPKYWQYDTDTANSRDPIRITQAERLHCLEHLLKMLIYRHRFSGFVNTPATTNEDRAKHRDLCRKAMQCALTIIADHVHISQRGMMTYYGVHVIHQLAQAGRTLVAVILNCRNADFRPLIAPSIEGLKSCVGLLRRFSGRYLCGLRSADIIDEFCRICNIPVDSPRVPDGTGRPPPAWLRPVRKRTSPSPAPPDRSSQTAANQFTMDAYGGSGDIMSGSFTGNHDPKGDRGAASLASRVSELEAMFNTAAHGGNGVNSVNGGAINLDQGTTSKGSGSVPVSANADQNGTGAGTGTGGFAQGNNLSDYIDLSALSPVRSGPSGPMDIQHLDYGSFSNGNGGGGMGGAGSLGSQQGGGGGNNSLDATLHGQWTMSPPANEQGLTGNGGHGHGNATGQSPWRSNALAAGAGMQGGQAGTGAGGTANGDGNDDRGVGGINNNPFDYTSMSAFQGFGGELLAGEGMDSVSDGLQSGEGQGLSAATILSLLEEGSFDYGSVFTDQAPIPMVVDEGDGQGGGGSV